MMTALLEGVSRLKAPGIRGFSSFKIPTQLSVRDSAGHDKIMRVDDSFALIHVADAQVFRYEKGEFSSSRGGRTCRWLHISSRAGSRIPAYNLAAESALGNIHLWDTFIMSNYLSCTQNLIKTMLDER